MTEASPSKKGVGQEIAPASSRYSARDFVKLLERFPATDWADKYMDCGNFCNASDNFTSCSDSVATSSNKAAISVTGVVSRMYSVMHVIRIGRVYPTTESREKKRDIFRRHIVVAAASVPRDGLQVLGHQTDPFPS